ncbi:MAG: hypothetical protein KGH64_03060 [Candidatus Micrarchaeota archaeon]|nr:hypothetical protein [Candidatus Micrarchaeota archaeon]MDE1859446.1 hypothetical protein [Candidatus Micrarchaeota archaeon]
MQIKAPQDTVLKFLKDTPSIAASIPDSSNFKKIDDKNFSIDLNLSVAGISGTFAVVGAITQATSKHFVYALNGSGIGSTIKIVLTIDISPNGAGSTNISWNSDSDISGLVSGLGEPVLRKLSNEKIDSIIKKVKSRIEKSAK